MELSAILESPRYQHLQAPSGSIELKFEDKSSSNNNTSIELPQEITQLITGSEYWKRAKANRYRKLIREGHLNKLMRLAAEALTKNSPANWFATVCSKAAWERTLDYLHKLDEIAKKAAYVAKKLKTTISKFIYKQIWHGVNVIHWADLAVDTPHIKPGQSPLKYFAWLCKHGEEFYGNAS